MQPKDAMKGTVVMYRETNEPLGRDLFSCSDLDWHFLQQLGTTFGWHMRGTQYQLPVGSKIIAPARHNYQPGADSDRKQVEEEDAIAWARTLESAKGSPHFTAMLQAHLAALSTPGVTIASLAALVDEFTEYAYGGAFSFSQADEANDAR